MNMQEAIDHLYYLYYDANPRAPREELHETAWALVNATRPLDETETEDDE